MTYTTELLENESGIQYQGVKDKTGGTGTYSITGLMTGIFKRGRFDKPMTITNENIRAQLGYDPKNSYYVAVQDVLSSGVPSVEVLRLASSNKTCINIAYGDRYYQVFQTGESQLDPVSFYDSVEIHINGVLRNEIGINSTGDFSIPSELTVMNMVVCAIGSFDVYQTQV